MPSGSPWSVGYDFANDPAAANYVNAAALQTQLEQLGASLAALYTALGVSIRDDDTLTDALVRLRNLHPELSSYLTGTTLSAALPFLTPADLATTGANITLSGEQTIDGTLTSGSRVLVKDQTDDTENGPYVTAAGAWTRATDMADAATMSAFGIQVAGGTLNANKTFALLTGTDGVVVGTDDALFFDLFPVAAGPTGPQGDAGNTILSGTAAPTTEGVDGDFYLRTTTNMLYGPKAGTWPAGVSLVGPAGATGATGSAGANGSTVLNGTVAPTTEGANGDFYINTVLKNIHGPKAGGVWPAGVSLIGPTGATGATGTDEYALIVLTGSGNWTPTFTGDVLVDASGGGGGGGGNNAGATGGGSGGGGYRVRKVVAVTNGVDVAYVVGDGGAAGAQYGNGGNGADTTFGALTAPGGRAGVSAGPVHGDGDPSGTTDRGGRNPTANAAGDPATGQGGAGSAVGGTVGFAGASGNLTIQRTV